MTRNDIAAAIAAHSKEMEAAIAEIDGSRARFAQTEPCGAKPNPEYARELGNLVHGIARGMAASFRRELAYSELTQRTLAANGELQRSIAATALGHAVRVAIILMAIGVMVVAIKAEPLMRILVEALK